MPSVTIELDDDVFRALEAEARAEQVSVPELLRALAAQRAQFEAEREQGREWAREDLAKFPDVFSRLAK